jgi:hypothetical protein
MEGDRRRVGGRIGRKIEKEESKQYDVMFALSDPTQHADAAIRNTRSPLSVISVSQSVQLTCFPLNGPHRIIPITY